MTITIAILRAAGLSSDQILKILELEETERLASTREHSRIRQRNYRSRNAVTRDKCDGVTETKPELNGWPHNYQDQFWAQYPRHAAKKTAMVSLERVKKSGIAWDKLMTGVARYAAQCTHKEPQYIKHPATWLNGGCWDDEYNGSGDRFADLISECLDEAREDDELAGRANGPRFAGGSR